MLAETGQRMKPRFNRLLAGHAINKTSSLLSRYVLNNWHSAEPRKHQQELVFITGGSSGIRKKMAEKSIGKGSQSSHY